MATYLPIEFLRKADEANMQMFGRTFDSMYDTHKSKLSDDVTYEDFYGHVLSKNFLALHDPKFEEFDKNLLENSHLVISDNDKNLNIQTEWRDAIIGPDLFYRWSKTKQVYKIDKDFYSMLLNTKNLTIEREIIEHLPLEEFYVDLSDLNLKDVHGMYVWIDWIEDATYLTFYILTYDYIFFSNYISFNYDENGKNEIDKNSLADAQEMPIADFLKQFETDVDRINKKYTTKNRDLSIFLLQLLMYIGSEMPDINESETTKHTYRPIKPGHPVKNKFSEMQMYEVGFKLGNNFRSKVEEIKNKSKSGSQTGSHASPMPHIRQAHWHKYWTGEGRQKLIVKWVEQTFVGFGSESKEAKIATIHKIKKEE